jgi:hypothetical protein
MPADDEGAGSTINGLAYPNGGMNADQRSVDWFR